VRLLWEAATLIRYSLVQATPLEIAALGLGLQPRRRHGRRHGGRDGRRLRGRGILGGGARRGGRRRARIGPAALPGGLQLLQLRCGALPRGLHPAAPPRRSPHSAAVQR